MKGAEVSKSLTVALALACVAVLARSAVFIAYRQAYFDSDQAIVGLMAKHLAEGRAFPLYYYGQTYLLGVDAWLAAVVFRIIGPSVSALHAALTLESVVAVVLLVFALSRDDKVPPLLAVGALLPFACAPPVTAAFLVDGAATAAPFVYIAALWMLRGRPLWFGVVAAVGFLHREFVAYAVLALLLLEAVDWSLWRRVRIQQWLMIGAAALATVQVVQTLKPYADSLGPGTRGQLLRGSSGSNVGNLSERVDFIPSELSARVEKMVVEHLPRIAGARFVQTPAASQGHNWLRWPFVASLALLGLRIVWLRFGGIDHRPLSLSCAAYLLATGLIAAAGYIVSRSLESSVDRYLLLTLFIPVGLVAWVLAAEPVPAVRRAAVALVAVLALSSAVDHVRLVGHYLSGKEPDDVPALVDALERRGVTVAISGYWRAYKLTFLANERVRIASSDFVRIEEYQGLANALDDRLMTLRGTSCAGDEVIPGWYLCRE